MTARLFAFQLLMPVLLFVAVGAAKGESWHEELIRNRNGHATDFEGKLRVTRTFSLGGKFAVYLKNETDQSFIFYGYSTTSPRIYTEVKRNGKWTKGWTGWCGTGIQSWKIEPGKTLRLMIFVPKSTEKAEPMRLLTKFTGENSRAPGFLPLIEVSPSEVAGFWRNSAKIPTQ